MSTYFFAGHESLTNRGCEALLRGITTAVRAADPQAAFFAPSFDEAADQRRWPEAKEVGVAFVPAYRLPASVRVWARVQTRWPSVRRLGLPRPGLPAGLRQKVAQADRCILTGGDVLSLDYGVPSLTRYLGQARAFITDDVPVALWAASVGPFSAAPDIERAVVHDLRRFSDISVRESASLRYLQSLGLDNVRQVVDPAFLMLPLPWDCRAVLPAGRDDGVLGFNVSPLVHKIVQRKGAAAGLAFEQGVIGFLRHVMETSGFGVVLVPHVDSVDGGAGNSDFLYMRDLLARSGLDERRITLAPRDLNAAQLKHLIGQCRFFIGARTHATIAAWSQHVPTVSLGYSVKARGLNADLFGDERFVLDTQALDARKLCSAFDLLRAEEDSTRAMLKEVIPTWQQRAHDAMPLSWKGQTT